VDHPKRNDQSTDNEDEDFATLFERSVRTKRFETGQVVDATIVAIGAEVAFVDVGAKGEATIALDELKNDDGVVDAKVGDRIQATVVSTTGGISLSRKLQRGAATRSQIENAFRAGLPVEGKVDGQVKGGYTVSVAGLRAFCPGSQIDVARDTDAAAHLGRVYTFRIMEFRDDGRKFVVSRRAWLETEQRERAAEVRRTLSAGAVVTGRVVSVRDFGAFVDLGAGVQGLLHVSEMGWSRVGDPSQMFKPGDEITTKILRIESKEGHDKIALGLKQLSDDPWLAVEHKYPVGHVAHGRVTRIAEFGAFVELEPGVVGLLPFAEAEVAKGDPRKALPIGTEVDVIVLEIDAAGRRIRLSVKAIRDASEAADVRDYSARSDAAAESAGFGSLADKLRGALRTRDK
jgi:small subunit ribosomal protein S1